MTKSLFIYLFINNIYAGKSNTNTNTDTNINT